MKKLIFSFFLCIAYALNAAPPATVLGISPNDTVKQSFYAQRNNTSNTVAGIVANHGPNDLWPMPMVPWAFPATNGFAETPTFSYVPGVTDATITFTNYGVDQNGNPFPVSGLWWNAGSGISAATYQMYFVVNNGQQELYFDSDGFNFWDYANSSMPANRVFDIRATNGLATFSGTITTRSNIVTTGSGQFIGNGAGLVNIPASSIVGLGAGSQTPWASAIDTAGYPATGDGGDTSLSLTNGFDFLDGGGHGFAFTSGGGSFDFSGAGIDVHGQTVGGLGEPSGSQDATTLHYVTNIVASATNNASIVKTNNGVVLGIDAGSLLSSNAVVKLTNTDGSITISHTGNTITISAPGGGVGGSSANYDETQIYTNGTTGKIGIVDGAQISNLNVTNELTVNAVARVDTDGFIWDSMLGGIDTVTNSTVDIKAVGGSGAGDSTAVLRLVGEGYHVADDLDTAHVDYSTLTAHMKFLKSGSDPAMDVADNGDASFKGTVSAHSANVTNALSVFGTGFIQKLGVASAYCSTYSYAAEFNAEGINTTVWVLDYSGMTQFDLPYVTDLVGQVLILVNNTGDDLSVVVQDSGAEGIQIDTASSGSAYVSSARITSYTTVILYGDQDIGGGHFWRIFAGTLTVL